MARAIGGDIMFRIKSYKDVQIIKHALQHYIKRDGASEKDIRQEKKVLDKAKEEVEWMKERYDINGKD